MFTTESKVHQSLKGSQVRQIPRDVTRRYWAQDSRGDYLPSLLSDLKKNGIQIDLLKLQKMAAYDRERELTRRGAMDAIQPTVTTASMPVPVQFLEKFLPGFVFVVTAARRADELMGIATIGDWYFEQIVQGINELTGVAQPYGDYSNPPFASWNPNWVYRTIVRFENGIRVGMLEEARSGQINIDTAAAKRESAALSLEIERNNIGFFGYNNGNNFTYGFLNDPSLPNYYTVPVGASTFTQWSTKTMLEITKDIRTMVEILRNNSADVIDPERVDLTLALPTAVVDYLTTISDFGYSVRAWMKDTYPRMRVVSAPELNGANGGANVGYLFADTVDDMSTDGGKVWEQVVPAKFMVMGVAKYEKYYAEDYSNATAGALLKRPFAVVRNSGI